MNIRMSVKAGSKAAPIPDGQKRAIPLLRDSGQIVKVKSGLRAGGPGRVKGQ